MVTTSERLKNNKTTSCGCYKKENTGKLLKKYNTYDLSNNYGIGYTSKQEEFYFDLADYDKIKDICWYINGVGYVCGHMVGDYDKIVSMHRFLINPDEGKIVDHKNMKKYDNRKTNLRIATHQQNHINKSCNKNSTTKVKGVFHYSDKYKVSIGINGKTIHLGVFDSIKEANKRRSEVEKKIYGEFSRNEVF